MGGDRPGNILLDFMDRDSREIWGTFHDFSDVAHRTALIHALNAACFLCYDYCVLPPVFVTLDDRVRSVLRRGSHFLESRVIRLPLKDQSLDRWIDRARQQYAGQQGWYDEVVRPDGLEFLGRHAGAVIARDRDVGVDLANQWAAGPDVSSFWRPAVNRVRPALLNGALEIPGRLLRAGSAITWTAIAHQLAPFSDSEGLLLRRMLQHEYFSVYAKEYDLSVLRGLPFARAGFAAAEPDPYYDYELFMCLAQVGGIELLVKRISARSLVELRRTIGHQRLQIAHWELTRLVSDSHSITSAYGTLLGSKDWIAEREIQRIASKSAGPIGINLERSELQEVEQRLFELAGAAEAETERLREQVELRVRPRASRKVAGSMAGKGTVVGPLLIVVALREELEVLISRWQLTNEFRSQAWQGVIGEVAVEVICSHGAGRVRAAMETAYFLSRCLAAPWLIVVTGIAGGFEETDNTVPGDVVVASNIADLGTRKMRSGADGDIPELRIEPFACDDRILAVVRSGSFNERAWANSAAQEFDYPRGSLPRVLTGTLVCTDEIVSSDEWRSRLLAAWPKAYGVEMEAGGVMSAAKRFGDVPVAVVRGVSDAANPLKADNEWRLRAARAAASLIEDCINILTEDLYGRT